MPQRATTVVLALALIVHAAIALVAVVEAPDPASDFDRYYQIARATERSGVDAKVEHPIGTLLTFKALAALPGGRATFGRAVVAVNAVADAVIIVALFSGWDAVAAAAYAVIAIPVAGLLFNRIDFWSMAAATVAVASWRRRRFDLSGAAIAVGALLKLWPVVFITGLAHPIKRSAVLTFFIAAGLPAILGTLALPRASVHDVLTFRGATGWQIESVVGSVLHLTRSLPIRLESGAWRIGVLGGSTSIVLFLIAMPIAIWCTWKGFGANLPGVAWLASVSTLLLLSSLLSAQYVGWLIPGAAIAFTERRWRAVTLVACAVVLTQLLWLLYGDVLDGARFATALVVVRNVVLVGLAVETIGELARASLAEAHLKP
ncbi:MAG TPA: glycosyltransferase 87 family protein [Vicinamibacterales bacterium]|jgi:hypothetical protein